LLIISAILAGERVNRAPKVRRTGSPPFFKAGALFTSIVRRCIQFVNGDIHNERGKVTDEASAEKKFLEEVQRELCAIRGLTGEIRKRVKEIEEKVSRFECRQAPMPLNKLRR